MPGHLSDADTVLDDDIRTGAQALGQALTEDQVNKLARLLEALGHWNRRINLTAIRDLDDMVQGHVLDSLAVRPHLEGRSVLDVGTGAGFPGLPLAIVEPDRRFTLLDSNGKKVRFVREMIGELGLENAEVVKARAEDYAPGARFDTVIARALATVPRLVELTGHLVGEDGQLLALKGRHPAEELEATESLPEWDVSLTALRVPGLESHERHLVTLRRKKADTR